MRRVAATRRRCLLFLLKRSDSVKIDAEPMKHSLSSFDRICYQSSSKSPWIIPRTEKYCHFTARQGLWATLTLDSSALSRLDFEVAELANRFGDSQCSRIPWPIPLH